jgi:hypothetical protein
MHDPKDSHWNRAGFRVVRLYEWHTACKRWSGKATRKVTTVLTCDYNGWNDAPEEEREWFDEHPEDLSGSIRDGEGRPLRATQRPHVRRFRGGLAA